MAITRHARPGIPAAVRVLAPVAAVACLAAAVTHLGVAIPLGVATLREPVIIPATIVEGLAGVGLAASSVAFLTNQPWARRATIGAFAFAEAGFILGFSIVTAGIGPSTTLNFVYHLAMLAGLTTGLALLMRSHRESLAAGPRSS